MVTKLSTLLLLVSLRLISGFWVIQPQRLQMNRDRSVTIVCEPKGWDNTWGMDAKLRANSNKAVVCRLYSNMTSFNCSWRKDRSNRILFTLFDLKPDDQELYKCEVSRMIPPPVETQEGNGTQLFSGPEPSFAPFASMTPSPSECPDSSLLNWILIGLSAFLFLTCLTITCAYVRLRIQQGNEMDDSLTYVPMQPPQPQNGSRRRGDPESNTTYMDMRKMASNGRASGRDMNYNSHQALH
ncbi:hypothetical protein MATL_G00152530 [Megalops atlanticus]|uniref:Ig-like domain-containing protein n=1 Tax=Megalops atlanticus TaxID=7932 RepID=A0A9D3T357_MEGAT|nr:hypothetical protein MATL_G00152530 [Megalops atlanticus]